MDKNTLRKALQPTLDGAMFPGNEDDFLTRYISQKIDNAETLDDLETDLAYGVDQLRRTKQATLTMKDATETEGEKLIEGETAVVADIRVMHGNVLAFDLNGVMTTVLGHKIVDNHGPTKAGYAKIEQKARLATGAKEVRMPKLPIIVRSEA